MIRGLLRLLTLRRFIIERRQSKQQPHAIQPNPDNLADPGDKYPWGGVAEYDEYGR